MAHHSTGLAAEIDARALSKISWPRAAGAINQCYEGYLLPVRFSPRDLQRRFAAEHVDRSASFLAVSGGAVVGAAAVARRGGAARLAAFGLTPAFRGRRLAHRLLTYAVSRARAGPAQTLELEVFARNAPALALYAAAGFEEIDGLFGFRREAAASPPSRALPLRRARRHDLAAALAADAADDLPWQLAPETLARMARPWQVIEGAAGTRALVNLARPDVVELRLLHTVAERRGRGQARQLVDAIAARAGGRALSVSQLVPSRLRRFALALGFQQDPLHQLRMRLELEHQATKDGSARIA